MSDPIEEFKKQQMKKFEKPQAPSKSREERSDVTRVQLKKVKVEDKTPPAERSSPYTQSDREAVVRYVNSIENTSERNKGRRKLGLQEVDKNGDLKSKQFYNNLEWSWYELLSNSEGSNSIGNTLGSYFFKLVGSNPNYYDGKIHIPRMYKDKQYNARRKGNMYTTTDRIPYRNYVRAFTLGDFTGFKPSDEIGRGRYTNSSEYSSVPYIIGNFYGDTIYAPLEAEKVFYQNLGKTFQISKDTVLNYPVNWNYADNTYDARNHGITFKRDNYKPSVLLEDVFNTNNSFVDWNNNPFIVNQEVPLVFTGDQEKLNRFQWLSNWFTNPRNVESNTQD